MRQTIITERGNYTIHLAGSAGLYVTFYPTDGASLCVAKDLFNRSQAIDAIKAHISGLERKEA